MPVRTSAGSKPENPNNINASLPKRRTQNASITQGQRFRDGTQDGTGRNRPVPRVFPSGGSISPQSTPFVWRGAVMGTHHFQPGTVVAVLSGYTTRTIRKATVAKVYKTGNFVLEGVEGQWRAWGAGATAVKTARDRWSRESCEIWSKEHDDQLAMQALDRRWSAATDAITKHRKAPSAAAVEKAEELAALLALPMSEGRASPSSPEGGR